MSGEALFSSNFTPLNLNDRLYTLAFMHLNDSDMIGYIGNSDRLH